MVKNGSFSHEINRYNCNLFKKGIITLILYTYFFYQCIYFPLRVTFHRSERCLDICFHFKKLDRITLFDDFSLFWI